MTIRTVGNDEEEARLCGAAVPWHPVAAAPRHGASVSHRASRWSAVFVFQTQIAQAISFFIYFLSKAQSLLCTNDTAGLLVF